MNIHSVMLVQSCVGKLCKLSEYHVPEGPKEAVCPLLAPWFRLQCTDLAQASGMILKADEAAFVTLPELKLLSIFNPTCYCHYPSDVFSCFSVWLQYIEGQCIACNNQVHSRKSAWTPMHLSCLLQEASIRFEVGLPEIEPHGAMFMTCRYNLNLADVLHVGAETWWSC